MLIVVAQVVLKFNGSVLEVRAVMLTGVTGDDILRIAVARHFGKFKPSSNVPFEADIYKYQFKNASSSSEMTSSSCCTIKDTSA
jgi:hypothetical protein